MVEFSGTVLGFKPDDYGQRRSRIPLQADDCYGRYETYPVTFIQGGLT